MKHIRKNLSGALFNARRAFFVSFGLQSFAVSGKRANFGCEKAKTKV
jgi:hypothetical protein